MSVATAENENENENEDTASLGGSVRTRVLVFLGVLGAAGGLLLSSARAEEPSSGGNAFALDLLKKLGKPEENVFYSPLSLRTALGVVHVGARGKTAEQMARVLHAKEPGAHDRVDAPQVTFASRLWGQKGYEFLPAFLKTSGVELEPVDFADPPAACKTINDWVADRTKGKIKDLMKPGVVRPTTRLVVTNAIHFEGTWARQFDKKQTRDDEFTLAGGDRVTVPFMHQKADRKSGLRHGRSERGDELLELPYADSQLSMVVVLPAPERDLAKVQADLDPRWWAALPEVRSSVDVYLPRFKLESDLELSGTLAELGMPDAFGEAADLSGINGKKDLFIQAVVHKSFVEVNEEGTEAAAASGVAVGVKSLPPTFRADRPFLFLIRDRASGTILFVGRVANPEAGA